MQDEARQKLENLRTQVLNELLPLVEQSTIDPAQKFDLLITLARSTGDPDRFEQAFQAAKSLESIDDKAGALFDLLDAMEFTGTAKAPQPAPESPEPTPQEEQPAQDMGNDQ